MTLTCAIKSIAGVSLVTDTPVVQVAGDRNAERHVRYESYATGMLMTCPGLTRSTLSRICLAACNRHEDKYE